MTTPVGYWCAGVRTIAPASGCGELGDDQPALIDPDRDRLESGVLDRESLPSPARILDGDAAHAARPEHVPQRAQPMRDAAGHHDPIGFGDHRPRPRKIRGEGGPQLRCAAMRSVAEADVGNLAERADQPGVADLHVFPRRRWQAAFGQDRP